GVRGGGGVRGDEPAGGGAARPAADRRGRNKFFGGGGGWMVKRGGERDHTRRYESASALGADVQHYLHDEPVLACPPSAMYRFGKFARRNKAVLAMASVVALAVVVLATSLVQIASEQQARQIAQRDKDRPHDERR